MGSGPIPVRPAAPMLFDTGAIVGAITDPGATVAASKYTGRIFYLRRADWNTTRFPDYVSASEAASYKAHGLTIVLNFEDAQPNWCLGGYTVGKDRGDLCAAQLTELDLESAHVYMSVDFQPANASEMSAVMECLRGFQESALGHRGRAVYGFAPVMREAKARGLADFYWMAGDGRDLFVGDWRAGVRADDLAHVNLWQQNNEQPWVFGVRVDDNYALTPDFGQWKPQEDPMADEAQQIATQLMGPDGAGFEILGRAVETAPDRDRYLTEAIAVLLTQVCGDPNFGGWTQLGDGPDSDTPKRTLVNAVAQLLRQNEQILAQNAQILAALTPKE
jgi:hypothetical protein